MYYHFFIIKNEYYVTYGVYDLLIWGINFVPVPRVVSKFAGTDMFCYHVPYPYSDPKVKSGYGPKLPKRGKNKGWH
jgi:hypothetical protein